MATDGKWLERLVASIEERALPAGFSVKVNDKIYNEQGVQMAEFDVQVTGRLGTQEVKLLIECRDRKGPADANWIYSLKGRKDIHGFQKVTAVSTSGFTVPAIEYAKHADIELREVLTLTNDDINWLGLRFFEVAYTRIVLQRAEVSLNQNVDKLLAEHFMSNMTDPFAWVLLLNGTRIPFSVILNGMGRDERAALLDNGPAMDVTLELQTSALLKIEVETSSGPIALDNLRITATINCEVQTMPFESKTSYYRNENGAPITETLKVKTAEFTDGSIDIELQGKGRVWGSTAKAKFKRKS